jgi:ABC-type Fe3+-hydroxamate transport system substrate-binding protein
MTISIEITDEKQLEQIEKLRGDLPAPDFVKLCVATGLRAARQAQEMQKNGPVVKFSTASPEFASHTLEAVTEAVKTNDPANPIVAEVKRLVEAYSKELKSLAERNGNRLPPRLTAQVRAPIEKVALDITTAAINRAIRDAQEQRQAAA